MSLTYRFRLYLNGIESAKDLISQLELMITEQVGSQFELEVLEVIDNLQKAEHDGVLVTPTLIMVSPRPGLKITGKYADTLKLQSLIDMANREDEE